MLKTGVDEATLYIHTCFTLTTACILSLLSKVVTMDSQLEEVLADQAFDPISLQDDVLKAGIRRLALSCSATPVLCGSSLKNVGVQPLMEAIVDYLPAPEERNTVSV